MAGKKYAGLQNPDDPEFQENRKQLGTYAENFHTNNMVVSETRKQALLKAWAAGMTFDELALRFEYTSGAVVRQIIERAVADSDIVVDRSAERARFTLSLLNLHSIAVNKAMDDDNPDQIAWMRQDLTIIDRLAKLLGLDAPTQVVVNPGADEFEKLTAAVAIANGASTIMEADPMADAEESE